MKKNNIGAHFSFFGYILFLIPLSITTGFSIVIYQAMDNKGFSLDKIALFLLLYIVFATTLFSLIDIIRRRIMVDAPVDQILKATDKIATGDFSVKLMPLHSYYKYDDYDKIMENLNKMTNELSKSEILKSEFISNVSHEIKTPLSVIQNYAKTLKNDKLDKETKEKYLSVLITASNKLSNLVSNILKLNKLEHQTLLPDNKDVNIGELLRENILQYENLFERKEIKLSCDIEDIDFIIDPSFLEIIYNNLISNAIKFTEPKGKISITLKNHDNHAVFSVKDTGLGISKDVGAHIFEKFYQGDTSHSSEGNGLGLALVKKVIDIIGGTITVQSEEKKGSTFTVKLKRN